MNSKTEERTRFYDARIIGTIGGYLIYDPNTKTIPWSDLTIEQDELAEIVKLREKLNACCGGEYILTEQGIEVLPNAAQSTKELLKRQLAFFVQPPCPRRKPMCDESSILCGRFKTMERYGTKTLEMFDGFVDKLTNLKIAEPSEKDALDVRSFIDFAMKNRLSLRSVLNKIISEETKVGDDVTADFSDVEKVRKFSDFARGVEYITPLFEYRNGKIVVTDAYEKNKNNLLPNLMLIYDFYYIGEKKFVDIVYSCMVDILA